MDSDTTKKLSEQASAVAKQGNYDCAAIVTFQGDKVKFYFASGNGKLSVDDTPMVLRRLIKELAEIADDIDGGKIKKQVIMKDTMDGDKDKFAAN